MTQERKQIVSDVRKFRAVTGPRGRRRGGLPERVCSPRSVPLPHFLSSDFTSEVLAEAIKRRLSRKRKKRILVLVDGFIHHRHNFRRYSNRISLKGVGVLKSFLVQKWP